MFKWLALLSSFFVTTLANADDCQRLKESLSVNFTGGMQSLAKPGESIQTHVKIKLSDLTIFETLPQFPLSFLLSNSLPGSKSLSEFLFLEASDFVNSEKDFDLVFSIPSNFQGRYTLVVNLAFYFGKSCVIHLDVPDDLFVDVIGNGDIVPPIVSSLNFQTPEYSMNDTARVEFQITDASSICTEEAKCENAVWHMAFKNEREEIANIFTPIHFDPQKNIYYSEFKIAEKDDQGRNLFSPGRYQIFVLDVQDVWGNMHVELPHFARKAFDVH